MFLFYFQLYFHSKHSVVKECRIAEKRSAEFSNIQDSKNKSSLNFLIVRSQSADASDFPRSASTSWRTSPR